MKKIKFYLYTVLGDNGNHKHSNVLNRYEIVIRRGRNTMLDVNTKYGTLKVEDTPPNYQVLVYFPRHSEELIEEFRGYFEKFGKYEKIMNGAKIFSNILGLENNNPTSELTSDDFEEPTIMRSENRKRMDCIDIFIRTREPTDIEERCRIERKSINPQQIAPMVENIEKYEASQCFLDELKD